MVLARSTGEAVLVDPAYRVEVLGVAEGVATVTLTSEGQPAHKRQLFKLRPEQGFMLVGDGTGDCRVLCCSVGHDKVRLGFDAPRQVSVIRAEIADEWAANAAADRAIGSLSDMGVNA